MANLVREGEPVPRWPVLKHELVHCDGGKGAVNEPVNVERALQSWDGNDVQAKGDLRDLFNGDRDGVLRVVLSEKLAGQLAQPTVAVLRDFEFSGHLIGRSESVQPTRPAPRARLFGPGECETGPANV